MKNFLLALIFFSLGFAAVLGYTYLKNQLIKDKPVIITAPTISPQPTFALVPPSTAVSGILTVTSGQTKKLSRGENEYKEASTGAQILLGESISTKENSLATATVSGIVNINLGPKSELVFTNLFPTNFVLQQKSGKIDYLLTQPIAVRALHSLISMEPGEVSVNTTNTDVSVIVKSGSIKLAIVDSDNNTKIFDLIKGQRANIDDAARQIYLIK